MKRYGFGADIGGTSCKIGLFKEDGTLLEKWEIKTNLENQGAWILQEVSLEIQRKVKEHQMTIDQIIGIGIGVPGPVEADGTVNGCVNLGWQRMNISQEMRSFLGVPVYVGNDANVAALGELLYGCGKGRDSLVMVTLGTGVGGGIVDRKKILCGANGAAGEIGHLTVNPQEREYCSCGLRGCLEQYVSATGIQKMAKQRLTANKKSTILDIETVTAKDVFEAAQSGDVVAEELVEEIATILARAMANIAVVVDPEIFALGGGVSNAGSYLSERVEKEFRKYAFHGCKETPIVIATMGNDAGIYGGMGLLIEEAFRNGEK